MLDWISRFFDGVRYYDFPSFEVALFSLMLAFLLSGALAMVYRWTYEGSDFPNHFFQGMVLSSTVSSMIMMAVGNNLAVGFGIIGAVAIIRFRMNVQNPRNIIFMFAALSIGIATGVYGYAVAVAGTSMFCLISVVLHYSPYGKKLVQYELYLSHEDGNADPIAILSPYCTACDFVQKRSSGEKGYRSTYLVIISDSYSHQDVFNVLEQSGQWQEIRLEIKSTLNRL